MTSNDKGSELIKQALGDEHTPLTERQREIAKKAAIFAVTTFNPDSGLGEKMLTPEQANFARNLHEVFPQPKEVLPKSEYDSAYAGYSRLVSTPMYELIPALVEDENRKFGYGDGFRDFEVSTEKFREDPTGVSYIRYMLQEVEEKSAIDQVELQGKEEDVRTKIAAIIYASKDVPDQIPESKPLDDKTTADDIIVAMMTAFGVNRNQRESFIAKTRNALHNELPMEIGEDGKILPSAALKVLGARLAFEQYQTAVNVFMNRWGNQTPAV